MDHRFQVFISSTFADLKEERQRVMQVIMEMDCIPAGMELFPAMDDDQLAFIKGVIDDCDYYVILIGGRYGSVNEQGVSYTEAEYDYAVAKVLKVVALLHAEPENIPSGKTESSDIGKKRLIAFREKVATGRLVRFWKSAEELPGLVALSLSKTIKAYPARGWVRGDTAASSDILAQLNQVRQENERLRNALQVELSRKAAFAKDLACGSDTFKLTGETTYTDGRHGKRRTAWSESTTWDEIFAKLGPSLMLPTSSQCWL